MAVFREARVGDAYVLCNVGAKAVYWEFSKKELKPIPMVAVLCNKIVFVISRNGYSKKMARVKKEQLHNERYHINVA